MYIPFLPNQIYHVYNRGNNREDIFLEDRNYDYFLELYQKYLTPIADTLSFCLLPNHFHFGIQMKSAEVLARNKPPHRCFANMMISYTKSINKAYYRRGSLFEKHLKRRLVTTDAYLQTLIVYIHRNPETHGFTKDFRRWPYSSYRMIENETGTLVRCESVLDWFGSVENFRHAHNQTADDGIFEISQR